MKNGHDTQTGRFLPGPNEAKPCEHCGSEILRCRPGRKRLSRAEFERKRFCSVRCMARAREGIGAEQHHVGQCSDCGHDSLRLYNGRRGTWVCRRCYRRHDWHTNPRTRAAARERYFGSTGLREAALERDDGRCQRCGATESPGGKALHVHHVDGDRTHNALANLRTLCHPCHNDVHREMACLAQ